MPLATLRWQPILHVDKPVTVRDGRCDGQKKQLAQRIPDLSGHPRVLQLIEMCEKICGHAACGGLRDNSNAFHCCPSRRDVAAVILTAWQLDKETSRRPGGASSEARLLSRTTPGVPFWPHLGDIPKKFRRIALLAARNVLAAAAFADYLAPSGFSSQPCFLVVQNVVREPCRCPGQGGSDA